jgi:putative ABC transport system permease protein
MKWFAFAWRNVVRNRRRTLLAMSIFAAGTVAVLCAAGFVLASFHGLREATIAGQLGHLQVGAPGQFTGFEDKPLASAMRAEDVARVRSRLEQTPHVRFGMQRLNFEGLVAVSNRTLATVGSGIEPELESRLSGAFASIVDGDGLPVGPLPESEMLKVLVAVDLARALGVKPGDSITVMATTERGALNALDLTVSGTYKTGIPELDRRAILMPLAASQLLLDTQRVSRVVAVLDATRNTDAVVQSLKAALPGLEVQGWHELAPFYRQVVSLYGSIFGVLGAIIVVVVLLSASNAMLMNLFERVREQGTMRAFGIPAWRIARNFLFEGGLVGLMGAGTGLLLAGALSLAVNLSGLRMPPPPGRTNGYPLLIFADLNSYGLALLGMTLVGVLAAWLSSTSVRRMSVLQQLNHN